MSTLNNETAIRPDARPQRFYCEGCREWHETESLLEAVRREGEQIEKENVTKFPSLNEEKGSENGQSSKP